MANNYIQQEANKIIKSDKYEFPLNQAMAAANIIANLKGINLKIFDASKSSSLADYYVIASAQNPTTAKSMVDEIMYNLKQNGAKCLSAEGLQDAQWILLDMGDTIIHIFQEVSRDVYDLDSIWLNHPQVEVPQEFYFGAPEGAINTKEEDKDDLKDYF